MREVIQVPFHRDRLIRHRRIQVCCSAKTSKTKVAEKMRTSSSTCRMIQLMKGRTRQEIIPPTNKSTWTLSPRLFKTGMKWEILQRYVRIEYNLFEAAESTFTKLSAFPYKHSRRGRNLVEEWATMMAERQLELCYLDSFKHCQPWRPGRKEKTWISRMKIPCDPRRSSLQQKI